MKNSLKGALLSGLIFPGLGQFWLKRRVWGTVLLLSTLGTLAVISLKLTERAYRLVEQAEAEGGQVDLVAVAKTVQAASYADPQVRISWLVLLAVWLVGVLHAFWEGMKLDRDGKRGPRSEGGGR
ncbi:hypothetical protein GMST_21590 [Geomonas silvestris]|uniref:DUF5683 domain-containing protein n=1 Tax=Geomonas silvestris TaxID=2740184 RepID=A0A6V8MIR2_9BACT|nr:hypothetical protein [Geomonas silvestris]GFO59834.1 hypothetical protein GMST_21590 [Geomonas silvestris]